MSSSSSYVVYLALVACSTSHGSAPDSVSGPDAALAQVEVSGGATTVTIHNGAVTIIWNKQNGTSDIACNGTTYISGAYASVDLGGATGYVKSTGYAAHTFAASEVTPVHDDFGDGVRVRVAHTAPGRPTIHQSFTLYAAHPSYALLDETVDSTHSSPIASNYLGALIVDAQSGWVAAPMGSDRRIIDAPFDNDEWVRWDSRVLGTADFSGTSYELAALYESASGAGLVLGSVTHDFWKTGVYYDYDSAHQRLRALNVWGGVATPDRASQPNGATYGGDGTHDIAAHGKQVGTSLSSPRIFVGCAGDWRDGLEEYGRANAIVAPPRVWAGGSPFGWMSWGAYGMPVTASQVTTASNFLATLAPEGFSSPAGVYVDIDAGFQGDSTCATQACTAQKIHANGQRAGTYRTPFSYWGSDLTAAVAGTPYTYADVVLRDDAGAPIRRHNAYMLDVTHPGTRTLIQRAMQSVVTDGFDLVKLDFLTDGAMEGRHQDPSVHTGIQAYSQAMAYIDSLLPPTIFVSESIAPIFPSQYAHARRISTDVIGQLSDEACPSWPHYGSTEYMLNALTFSWWMQGTLYALNDPDGMALVDFKPSNTAMFPAAWAQTRVSASAIAGTMFFDTTDYSTPTGTARASAYLGNAQVDALASTGRAFRPVDGGVGYVGASTCDGRGDTNAGSRASELFVRDEGGGAIALAAFNFGTTGKTVTVDLSRLGLAPGTTYTVRDLWLHTTSTASDSLAITLTAGESTLLMIDP
jgi:hypothetical protein